MKATEAHQDTHGVGGDEAALGWDRYVGRQGGIIAMRSCGISAPGKVAQAHFGFDLDHVLTETRRQLALRAARA